MASRAQWVSACTLVLAAIGAVVVTRQVSAPPGVPRCDPTGTAHDPARSEAARAGRIAGTVVWAGSGEPTPNAWIQVWPESLPGSQEAVSSSPEESTVTDASGRFVVEDLRESSYTVTATAWPPDVCLRDGARPPNMRRVRLAGVRSGTDGVRIEAVPGCAIVGRVIREGGHAVGGVWVSVTEASRLTPEMIAAVQPPVYLHWMLGMPIEDGKIDVIGLEPVEHVLRVSSIGFAAEFVRWSPGERLGTVILRPGGSIRGRVIDESGKAVQGVRVRAVLSEIDLRQSGGATTDASGAFLIEELRPATYRVVGVDSANYERTLFDRDGAVVSRGQVTDVGDVQVNPR